MTPTELIAEWRYCKEVEKNAVTRRREIEDELVKQYRIRTDVEVTNTLEIGDVVVKVVPRLDRKVDAAKAQELAAEHGIEDYLSLLFKWHPDINMAAWKTAPEGIQMALSGAITTKAGRPSFSIKE